MGAAMIDKIREQEIRAIDLAGGLSAAALEEIVGVQGYTVTNRARFPATYWGRLQHLRAAHDKLELARSSNNYGHDVPARKHFDAATKIIDAVARDDEVRIAMEDRKADVAAYRSMALAEIEAFTFIYQQGQRDAEATMALIRASINNLYTLTGETPIVLTEGKLGGSNSQADI